jgi:uncharacterized protein YwgA
MNEFHKSVEDQTSAKKLWESRMSGMQDPVMLYIQSVQEKEKRLAESADRLLVLASNLEDVVKTTKNLMAVKDAELEKANERIKIMENAFHQIRYLLTPPLADAFCVDDALDLAIKFDPNKKEESNEQ